MTEICSEEKTKGPIVNIRNFRRSLVINPGIGFGILIYRDRYEIACNTKKTLDLLRHAPQKMELMETVRSALQIDVARQSKGNEKRKSSKL